MDSVTDFKVRAKVLEAFKSGKYMITVAYVRGKKLYNNTFTSDFPNGDIEHTIKQTLKDLASEIPFGGPTDDKKEKLSAPKLITKKYKKRKK